MQFGQYQGSGSFLNSFVFWQQYKDIQCRGFTEQFLPPVNGVKNSI